MDETQGVSEQEGTPAKPRGLRLKQAAQHVDWKRTFFIILGLALFAVVYFSPAWPDAVDPNGERSILTREGKAALALFLLAATWWVTEVVPIGVTAIVIGVMQALFLIRPARVAFTDFMDSSVWFIFASIMIGIVFTRTGLAKRMAYRMLVLVGERTSMIYLGFGKGLFIGMAFAAGAGSIVTLLGAARGAVAISFFKDMVGREIAFFELSMYMFPIGWVMVFLIWGMCMIMFRPEKKRIPGLRNRAKALHARLGPITRNEIMALVIVASAVLVLSLRSFIPAFKPLDKSGVILVSTVLFFLFKVLTVKELEEIPWNIILLFGGAMSIGYCLYQTEAAKWLAINWLVLFQGAHWFLFIGGVAFFVLIMTNLIMNVAAIAISLPVALVLAPYLGVAPEVIFFCSLVAAGMPFLFLVGAAPNAIAYESKQFTSGEFFRAGIPASLVLMLVLAAFVAFIWPMMGMPINT